MIHAPANDDTMSISSRCSGVPEFRADYLNRYFADPVFRAEQDALRARQQERRAIEIDRQILANFRPENFPETPGWVAVFEERIAAFDAGLSHEEALRVSGGGL